MKQKIMILGAGLMQSPAIKSAQNLGYEVVVVDGNPNAPCIELADSFEHIDLKDKDSLVKLADKINSSSNMLAAVFTAGTDFSANVAFVSEHCGLFGHSYKSCINASNKVRMRECFKKFNVPSPSFEEIDSEKLKDLLANKNKIKYPKVIKPVDNMGGRGCRLVRNSEELENAVLLAIQNSRTSKAIFEDYMEGPEFSIDSVVYNGTLTITGFADRHIYYPPYFIETGHTMPTAIDEKIKNELIATFALGIKSLGLTCGVAKADIKYTKNGPMIGEIAARLSGGYMSGWTYPYSSDCNLTEQALLISLGKEPDFLIKNRVPIEWTPHDSVQGFEKPFELYELKSKKVSAERAWISIPGKIKAIEGYDSVKKSNIVKDILPRTKIGDNVNFPRNNVEKCGNVITVSNDYAKAVVGAEKAISSITVRLEPFNKVTDDFLNGKEESDEKGFPPSAFDIQLTSEDFIDIPSNQPVEKFMSCSLEKKCDLLKDWNHNTLRTVLQRFDLICPNHSKLDGKKFWSSVIRGSIQGALYVADCSMEK
ncbi:MAG: ATP-grasp domain-containing protein [Treponema sp.]|nr:ATP-grasp domain-containing protein [Treponema sp.]